MRYVFGEWTLDTQRAELSCAGHVRRLRRKAFQVLAYLLARADRVVSKQELCEQVWPQQFISEAALEGTVKAVRQALGDSGRDQRLIQTVYGLGYRFIAAVDTCPDAPTDPESAARPASLTTLATPPQAVHDASPLGTVEVAGGNPALDTGGEEASLQHCVPASAGEWKLVTVLCCALVEELRGAPLDVEPHYRVLQAFSALAQEVVQRYGGTLQPVIGDQVMALFGVPQAQEDHARCAVLAALDLQQRLHPLASGAGRAVRMGAHSGLAVVGALGSEAHGPVTAVGTPTQGALRLQQQAAPGTLLVSATTYALVQMEVWGEPCGSLALDGPQEPLPVYAVQGLVQRRAGVPQRTTPVRSPFVGRQRELALLHDRLEAARGGEGQVVSLVGPPGIGKTRLLMEFGRGLEPDQVTWVLGQCLAYGQNTPYLPVQELVQSLGALAASDPLEARTAAVRRWLAALGEVAEDDIALLCQLLDLPVAPEVLQRLSPVARQARTFTLLEHLIRRAARPQPLVLAVENVHWIDPTSATWLTFLIERLAGMAVLLLVTQRPDAPLPWGAHAAVTQLALPPLRPEESQAIVAAVPGTAQLPEARRQQLVAHGAGNPFFLEELAWHAVEHGPATTPGAVPATVHAVLAARLDRLPTAAKALLQVAAVLGPDVPLPLVQALAALPEATVQQGLTHLQAAQVLYATRLVPERVYTFKHALTQEVAYGSLLQERRRALHARVVEALEALAGEGLCRADAERAARNPAPTQSRQQTAPQVERLAHHALRGEVWDKALVYFRQAGEKAMARSAYHEAVGYFEQALSALPHLPEQRATCEQAIDLRLALRSALRPLGALERILTVLREAEALAAALDDSHRLGQVACFLSFHFYTRGAYEQAIAAAQRALALATTGRESVLRALATQFLGFAYQGQGDYRRAIDCHRQTVAALDGARRRERYGLPTLPVVFSYAVLAWHHAELGLFAEGRAFGDEGLHLAEAVAHAGSLMGAYWGCGLLALRQGDLCRALPLLERAVGSCQDAHLPFFFPRMVAALGAAYTLAGRSADTILLLTPVLEQPMTHHMVGDQTLCTLALGEAQMRVGYLEEARALAERALALTHAHQERGNQVYALHLLGDIAAWHEPPEVGSAVAYYRQALALAEALGMRPLQAHCHRNLGTLYAQMGQREQGRAALATATALYRAMEMTFWLSQTEAALAQVEGW